MKYYVTLSVEARYIASVEAENIEEARRAAEVQFWDADLGEAEDIEGEPIIVEDEDGNILWEK